MNSMRDKDTIRELLQSFEQDVSTEYLFRNIPKAQFYEIYNTTLLTPTPSFRAKMERVGQPFCASI